eukprot:8350762-Pyramimonas_sp.AAC.1
MICTTPLYATPLSDLHTHLPVEGDMQHFALWGGPAHTSAPVHVPCARGASSSSSSSSAHMHPSSTIIIIRSAAGMIELGN